jgi:hypothetical protein
MPSIGQTWVLASIGAVVEMGVLSTLKRLLIESTLTAANFTQPSACSWRFDWFVYLVYWNQPLQRIDQPHPLCLGYAQLCIDTVAASIPIFQS